MEFTHVANPVRVKAEEIVQVIGRTLQSNRGIVAVVLNENGDPREMVLGAEMVARYEPQSGDYLVTQEDGYQYINPKAVFERKYRLVDPTFENSGAALVDAFDDRDAEIARHNRTPEQIDIEQLKQQLAAVQAEVVQARCLGMQNAKHDVVRDVRHSILLAMIPSGRGGLLKQVDEAAKYVMTGALPESK